MRFFATCYVFREKMRLPDGSTDTVKITGNDFGEFAHNAFMAGVRWGQEHPDLEEKKP